MTETLMFLPGASGNTDLWKPVADSLSHGGPRLFVSWPGLGGAPADPSVTEISDLVERVVKDITGPTILFAQSMGGLIALRAALEVPHKVRSLVLSVTSGGVDVRALGGADWRPWFEEHNPGAPRWFLDAQDDMTPHLHQIGIPALLLWGDADPISPVAVGRRLAELLPLAELVIVPGGTHDLVAERATDVLPAIERHLARPDVRPPRRDGPSHFIRTSEHFRDRAAPGSPRPAPEESRAGGWCSACSARERRRQAR
jgi:pimeloyl-ACP methyl ester carboxylesterase